MSISTAPPSSLDLIAPDGSSDDYVLGRSDAETRRLISQHQVYGPITRQFLRAAGVTAGMKVLDLGSGAGDVALLLADLVGPRGQVVGVDMNGDILDVARGRVRSAGWSNVRFHRGNLRQLPVDDGDFDAVVGRWILMYVPDPAELIRQARARLRPGGIIAFQESDLRQLPRPYPPLALHEQVIGWLQPPPDFGGPETEMGPKLFRTFLDAGLPAPELRLDGPIGGGPDWPGYGLVAETVRSLLPFLEAAGTVSAADVDIDTLEARLRAEIVDHDAVQALAPVISAWARATDPV